MEKGFDSNSVITSQSIGKYMQDIWLIAFFFVLIPDGASLSLTMIWLVMHALILICVLFIFRKTGYQIAVPLLISLVITLSVFLFGAPFWFYLAVVFISVWRIQERFATEQDDLTHDGFYYILLIIFFTLSIFVSTVVQNNEAIRDSYVLVISGVVIYIIHRLIVHWQMTKTINHIPFYYIVIFFGGIMGIASSVYFIVSLFAEKTRILFVALFGDLLMLLFVPLGTVLNWFKERFQSIAPPEEEQKESVKQLSEALDELKPLQDQSTQSLDFPWMIFIVIATILVIYLLWRLSIKRLEKNTPKKNEEVSISREPLLTTVASKSKEVPWAYSMETNIVREAYRSFERQAREVGLARLQDETVREWFSRQKWDGNKRFFSIYDTVRYGQTQMSGADGEWFITQLELFTEKYFSNEV
ncbi:MAG: hypothetical protein ABWX61_00735 [Paenisporosarcina sp.]